MINVFIFFFSSTNNSFFIFPNIGVEDDKKESFSLRKEISVESRLFQN